MYQQGAPLLPATSQSNEAIDETSAQALGWMDSLPQIQSWSVEIKADSRQWLPPLPTTALHGALGHAMIERCCELPQKSDCSKCPLADDCGYALFFEPSAPWLTGLGITGRAPTPLVIAPGGFNPAARRIELAAGERLMFRVGVIGDHAIMNAGIVWNALEQALDGGLGIDNGAARGGRRTRQRPKLHINDVRCLPERRALLAQSPETDIALALEFVSPVRLPNGRQAVEFFESGDFLAAVLRRAKMLSYIYGELEPRSHRFPSPALSVVTLVEELNKIRVRRYSSRQGRQMHWTGFMGRLLFFGGDLRTVAPALYFGQMAQVGKGTGFGFGRYRLMLR